MKRKGIIYCKEESIPASKPPKGIGCELRKRGQTKNIIKDGGMPRFGPLLGVSLTFGGCEC